MEDRETRTRKRQGKKKMTEKKNSNACLNDDWAYSTVRQEPQLTERFVAKIGT